MEKFIAAHQDNIHGVISCVDRIIFKGYSPLSWTDSMMKYLNYNNLLIKDFKSHAQALSHRLRDHGKAVAAQYGRPYFPPEGKYDKEDRARAIIERDHIDSGLVAVMAARESSPTFQMVGGAGRPRLVPASIPQLCLYYYLLHPEFGLMHIRIQTWLPFTVQIYLNGHDWLARRMTKSGIDYEQLDNCFVRIGDPARAQALADEFLRLKWAEILPPFARQVNPLPEECFPQNYYWVTDQAEYATDVMFKNNAVLEPLYEKLLESAIRRFGPKDVLTFLGKKFDGRFTGEQINSMKKRWPGTRVKHWVRKNWMKMYDKFGRVLRVETVFNDPYGFKVLRYGKRDGETVYGWFPLGKGVANLYRYGEIGAVANGNYLDALAVEPDPRPARESLQAVSEPVTRHGHRYGGFNPLETATVRLFKAVMNGDYIAAGLQNRDLREALFEPARSRKTAARLSAKAGRLLKKLQIHGLIAKVPRSRRWRVTANGWTTMSTAIEIYDVGWAQMLDKQAA